MKLHFIGVGGTAMGAAACMLARAGHDVRGSEGPLYPPMSTQLLAAGLPVFSGFSAEHLDWGPERVVVGNICSKDHVEVAAARARGLPLVSLPALLAELLLPGRRSLVVAGTHGKTTTSALLTWILRRADRDPAFLIGGVPQNLGRGAHLGGGEVVVLEGDEYDTAFFDKGAKFLHYAPTRAIVTSVEYDHADIFADEAAVRATFEAFVRLLPEDGTLVVFADDPGAVAVAAAAPCEVLDYRVLEGISSATAASEATSGATYVARVRKGGASIGQRRTRFQVFERGIDLGEFSTLLVGHHNVANALAALALARREGVDVEVARDAIRRFRGVRRRQELLGVAQGIRIISDFAHHPTEVRLTTRAIRKRHPHSALHVCFDPRSASSRRKVFFDAYAESFAAATRVHIGPLYAPEKIPEDERLDPVALARRITAGGPPATAYESVEALASRVLEQATSGDTVLILSCGAFGGLGDRLLEGLGDAVEFANEEDYARVDELCERCNLASIEDRESTDTLVIRGGADKSELVGCVSLEVFGDDALLFSLAIAPERRGEGLGWVLAGSVVRWANTLGAGQVYLMTEAAADFFGKRLGFRPIPLASVPATLRVSTNFRRATTRDEAVCMVLDLEDVS